MRSLPRALCALVAAVFAGSSHSATAQSATPPPAATGSVPTAATIHEAALRGELGTVTRLLDGNTALVSARNDEGITPLVLAAASGHLEVVRLLIDRGADPSARDRRGFTPLYVAVWRDRPEVARVLIEKGADPRTATANGMTPLHAAAIGSQVELARLLIARRADLEARNAFGNTPLHVAAAFNVEGDLARLLVDAGAQVNATNAPDGATPLEVALREGRTAVAEALRSKGATARELPARPLRGPYLGQSPPGTTPGWFAPNLVSTERSELNAVFSPDGTEFYFARSEGRAGTHMRTVVQEGGVWGRPRPVTFVRDYSSVDMFVSRDGQRLLFCSDRPLDGTGPAKKDTDIWSSTRTAVGWSEPVNLGENVCSDANDYYPTLTATGDLYFSSPRPGGLGGNDIYRSRLVGGRFGPAENLGREINTGSWEFDPFIAPDESFIVFASDRPDGQGGADLYASFRSADGSWSTPQNLGAQVNSAGPDFTPMLSPDGAYLFFTSGRNGGDDIYWVSAAVIDRLRPTPARATPAPAPAPAKESLVRPMCAP